MFFRLVAFLVLKMHAMLLKDIESAALIFYGDWRVAAKSSFYPYERLRELKHEFFRSVAELFFQV